MPDILTTRSDFPILQRLVYDKPLVYFDNAATTQKPQCVIDAISNYYCTENANVHRGVHFLSQQATRAFEGVRQQIGKFINARLTEEIIYTRGTTEAINLVASSFGKKFIRKGDEILISAMEHHSNIVPWQFVCEERQAKLKVIPITDNGELEMDKLDKLITGKTKIIAITHVSNTLGTVNPVKEIIRIAHSHGIPVLVDGAQAVPHLKVDVQDLDCDFYAFSGHKVYGPMGIGCLYGKESWLNKLPPYQGGGEMIANVTFEKTTYNSLPYKFEAGTPNVADVVGFGTALDYINAIGIENIGIYENELLKYATAELEKIEGLRIIGTAADKASVISFVLDKIHPYDAGTIMDHLGVAVRTGNHCTQPIIDRYKIPGTIRASFAFYNTKQEIDVLIQAILKVKEMFL
ncbi:MAG TPA: cysteine desulfurase [Bacteroidales bacterium]|nr:cysteine desulfurase [Bacteroidales bacterium]